MSDDVIQIGQLWVDNSGVAEVLSITMARGGAYLVMQRRRGNPFLVTADQLIRYWRIADMSFEDVAAMMDHPPGDPTREVFRVEYVACPRCQTHVGFAHDRCCERRKG